MKGKHEVQAHIMLEGLEGEIREMMLSMFEKVDFSNINDVITEQTMLPVLRHMVAIVEMKTPEDIEWRKKLWNMIDVPEVQKELQTFNEEFMLIAEEYLPHLDAQAEMTVLFCTNYITGMVNKYMQSIPKPEVNNNNKTK